MWRRARPSSRRVGFRRTSAQLSLQMPFWPRLSGWTYSLGSQLHAFCLQHGGVIRTAQTQEHAEWLRPWAPEPDGLASNPWLCGFPEASFPSLRPSAPAYENGVHDNHISRIGGWKGWMDVSILSIQNGVWDQAGWTR